MGAQGSQAGINVREETVWGELDPGQFTGLNFVSEDMAYNIENQRSNNVRPDRQTSDLIQVGAECGGGFETELQAKNLDLLLPGFLWDTAWHTPPPGENCVFTIETGGGDGGVITVADSSLWTVGKVFGVDGTASNDGILTVKDIPDATHIQVVQPLITEASIATTFTGDTIRNGVTKHSFSIERALNDISQFFLYKGMVPNTLEVGFESGNPVTANISFVGKNEVTKNTQYGTLDPVALSTEPIMSAVSSVVAVLIDNVVMEECLLQKLDFTLDNQVEGKKGVGVLGFCNAEGKSIAVTGAISMYFNDVTYYEKYLNSTSFSIQFTLTDTLGNTYVMQLPECKFDAVTANVTGKDDDVLVEGTYEAIFDPTNQYTIQITRFLI